MVLALRRSLVRNTLRQFCGRGAERGESRNEGARREKARRVGSVENSCADSHHACRLFLLRGSFLSLTQNIDVVDTMIL